MEEPLLNEEQRQARSRLDEIQLEIRFLNSNLEQLEDHQEQFKETSNLDPDLQEKIREGKTTIKAIQLLIKQYNNGNSPYFDEFKAAEKKFKELVNLFNNLTAPKKMETYDNEISEEDEENCMDFEVGKNRQVSWIQEDTLK